MFLELSVKSLRSGDGIQPGTRKKDHPFQGVMNSYYNSSERVKVWWRVEMEELRSIILLRKVLPAGTTFAAKLRVPMGESSSLLEQVERLDQLVGGLEDVL